MSSCTKKKTKVIGKSMKRSINQSIAQSIKQSNNRSVNQSSNRTLSQSINQSIGQSTKQSINQSTNRPSLSIRQPHYGKVINENYNLSTSWIEKKKFRPCLDRWRFVLDQEAVIECTAVPDESRVCSPDRHPSCRCSRWPIYKRWH